MTAGEAEATDQTQPATAAEAVEQASEGSESDAAQDVLTQSVGQRLTRKSHDTHRPRWKRLLGKS